MYTVFSTFTFCHRGGFLVMGMAPPGLVFMGNIISIVYKNLLDVLLLIYLDNKVLSLINIQDFTCIIIYITTKMVLQTLIDRFNALDLCFCKFFQLKSVNILELVRIY